MIFGEKNNVKIDFNTKKITKKTSGSKAVDLVLLLYSIIQGKKESKQSKQNKLSNISKQNIKINITFVLFLS